MRPFRTVTYVSWRLQLDQLAAGGPLRRPAGGVLQYLGRLQRQRQAQGVRQHRAVFRRGHRNGRRFHRLLPRGFRLHTAGEWRLGLGEAAGGLEGRLRRAARRQSLHPQDDRIIRHAVGSTKGLGDWWRAGSRNRLLQAAHPRLELRYTLREPRQPAARYAGGRTGLPAGVLKNQHLFAQIRAFPAR